MAAARLYRMMTNHKLFIIYFVSVTVNFLSIQSQNSISEPRDIRRSEGETNIYIPCPFGVWSSPSIWKIDDKEYTYVTLPSPPFEMSSSVLCIDAAYQCLNQTSFQCIDTSHTGLRGEKSSVGILTVTVMNQTNSKGDKSCYDQNTEVIELDHQHLEYGSVNTTLSWKISSKNNCSIRIQSHPQCLPNNIVVNATVDAQTQISVSTEELYISGHLADFVLSGVPAIECPQLSGTLRFNVTKTETINLLLASNDCVDTCVEMDCRGGLNVAISTPDPNRSDDLCPVFTDTASTCYNPSSCHQFNDTSFFYICEHNYSSSRCTYKVCFKNVTEQLNGTRLDFFVLKKICSSSTAYTRVYVRSMKIKVIRASADISVNTTTGEICFFSISQTCNLTHQTWYNVSISDSRGDIIFENGSILESTCVIVDELLHSHCDPFMISAQPFNDYIMYSSIGQQIRMDHQENLTTCCPRKTYKHKSVIHNVVQEDCLPCPNNSQSSGDKDATICPCLPGYFRARQEGPEVACTQPPTACRNINLVSMEEQSASISWKRPVKIGRSDFYYIMEYSDGDVVRSDTVINHHRVVHYSVSGLKYATEYTITVTAENGVSDQDPKNEFLRKCELKFMTQEGRPSAPIHVQSLGIVIVWQMPAHPNGVITGYTVQFYIPGRHISIHRHVPHSKTFYKVVEEDFLDRPCNTHVRVRAKTEAGSGPWSSGISLEHPSCKCPICPTIPTQTPVPSVHFTIKGRIILNNSVIFLSEVGEGEDALQCKTDHLDCCATSPNLFGEFYYPSGIKIPSVDGEGHFYHTRGDQEIRLNRRKGISSEAPTGKFRCEIPNANGLIQNLYIILLS